MGVLKGPEKITTNDGRYLIGVLETEDKYEVGVFIPCGACGGRGCEACSHRGHLENGVRPDVWSEEIRQYVNSYSYWIQIASAIMEAVRVEPDLLVFPADVKKSMAARITRFAFEKLNILHGNALCDYFAERIFFDESNIVRKKEEIDSSNEQHSDKT